MRWIRRRFVDRPVPKSSDAAPTTRHAETDSAKKGVDEPQVKRVAAREVACALSVQSSFVSCNVLLSCEPLFGAASLSLLLSLFAAKGHMLYALSGLYFSSLWSNLTPFIFWKKKKKKRFSFLLDS